MLAAVIEGPGAVVVRFPPGGVAQTLAASERPEHRKIVLDLAGPWLT
jgi:hypothetical protein